MRTFDKIYRRRFAEAGVSTKRLFDSLCEMNIHSKWRHALVSERNTNTQVCGASCITKHYSHR